MQKLTFQNTASRFGAAKVMCHQGLMHGLVSIGVPVLVLFALLNKRSSTIAQAFWQHALSTSTGMKAVCKSYHIAGPSQSQAPWTLTAEDV